MIGAALIGGAAQAETALDCRLETAKGDPMIVTLDDRSHTVQVTMARQTYTEDVFDDGPLAWWQVKSRDGTIIRSRFNRADGTIMITNSMGLGRPMMVKGICSRVRVRKF